MSAQGNKHYVSCVRKFASTGTSNPTEFNFVVPFEPEEFRVIGYQFIYDINTPANGIVPYLLRIRELYPDTFLLMNGGTNYDCKNIDGPFLPTRVSPNTRITVELLDADDAVLAVAPSLTANSYWVVLIEFRKYLS